MPTKKKAAKSAEQTEELDEKTFTAQLEGIYVALTSAGTFGAIDGMRNGFLSVEFAETILPGLVLSTAILTGLCDEPPTGDAVLGDHSMPAAARDEFLQILAKPIDELKAIIEADLEEIRLSHLYWITPTPAETIKTFCIKNQKAISTKFVNMLWEAKNGKPYPHEYQDGGMQRLVTRRLKRPELKTERAPTKSQMDFAKLLHKVITQHDPARFGHLKPVDFIWRRK